MAFVTVEPAGAIHHSALRLAGRRMRVPWKVLAWRLLEAWLLVADDGLTVLPRSLVAEMLRVPVSRLGGLVSAGLANDAEDGAIDLSPLGALYAVAVEDGYREVRHWPE